MSYSVLYHALTWIWMDRLWINRYGEPQYYDSTPEILTLIVMVIVILKIIEILVELCHHFLYHSVKVWDLFFVSIQLSSEKRIWISSVSSKNYLCARNIELGKVKLLPCTCLKTFAKYLNILTSTFISSHR